MPVLRALIAIPILVLAVASASVAAPTVGAPTGHTRFALGGPEHEFADIQPTSSGWLLVGSAAGESGSQALVAAVDTTGRTLWQTRIAAGVGLAAAVGPSGSIWVATASSPATPLIDATATPEPTATVQTPIDPDGIGTLAEMDSGRIGIATALHLLGADGQLLTSLDVVFADGWVAQPTALVPWKDGALLVGTAISPQGATTGFVVVATEGGAAAPVLLGSANTTFTSAAVASSGVALIAGSSGETLLGKARLGTQDAVVANFNGTRFTKVIRSGGGQRTWNTIIANPAGGYTAAGSAVVSGRKEAVVSNFTATGTASWSTRLPGSTVAEEQRLLRIGTSLRLAIPASIANATLYPGWVPKGASDVLVLTLDPAKGRTVRATVVSSAGREELVDGAGASSGGALLIRSDGVLAASTGTGSVILTRLGSR